MSVALLTSQRPLMIRTWHHMIKFGAHTINETCHALDSTPPCSLHVARPEKRALSAKASTSAKTSTCRLQRCIERSEIRPEHVASSEETAGMHIARSRNHAVYCSIILQNTA